MHIIFASRTFLLEPHIKTDFRISLFLPFFTQENDEARKSDARIRLIVLKKKENAETNNNKF